MKLSRRKWFTKGGLLIPAGLVVPSMAQTILINSFRYSGGGPPYSRTNLLGEWLMQEGSGTSIADTSGNSHTGTLGSGVTWTTGPGAPISNALDFSGDASSQAKVDTAGSIGLAADSHVTFGIVLKLDSRTAGDGLIGEVSGLEFILRIAAGDNTKWEFILNSFSSNDRVSGGANDLTNWFSVFGRFDGSTIDLFENGTEVATVTPTGSWAGTSQPIQFGTFNSGTATTMDGQIAWSAIWARGLSDAEIADIHNYFL